MFAVRISRNARIWHFLTRPLWLNIISAYITNSFLFSWISGTQTRKRSGLMTTSNESSTRKSNKDSSVNSRDKLRNATLKKRLNGKNWRQALKVWGNRTLMPLQHIRA